MGGAGLSQAPHGPFGTNHYCNHTDPNGVPRQDEELSGTGRHERMAKMKTKFKNTVADIGEDKKKEVLIDYGANEKLFLQKSCFIRYIKIARETIHAAHGDTIPIEERKSTQSSHGRKNTVEIYRYWFLNAH